jgi:hypothetical protein
MGCSQYIARLVQRACHLAVSCRVQEHVLVLHGGKEVSMDQYESIEDIIKLVEYNISVFCKF